MTRDQFEYGLALAGYNLHQATQRPVTTEHLDEMETHARRVLTLVEHARQTRQT